MPGGASKHFVVTSEFWLAFFVLHLASILALAGTQRSVFISLFAPLLLYTFLICNEPSSVTS